MKLFMRKKEEASYGDITRMSRLMKTDYPTLLTWFDNTIMGLGSSFDRWRFHDGPIEEVIQHVEALDALMNEIKIRKAE